MRRTYKRIVPSNLFQLIQSGSVLDMPHSGLPSCNEEVIEKTDDFNKTHRQNNV